MRMRQIGKLAIVCAVGAAAVGCSSVDPFANTIEVTADFENIAGMYPGNEVSVLGLPVGSVDSVEPKGSYITVKMSFDGDVKVPADAVAALISPSLVTNRHVELAPAYTDGPTLANGDHIPLDRTRTPVELDRVLKTVDELAASLKNQDGSTEGPLSGGILIQTLEGNGDKIRDTLAALNGALSLGVTNRDAVSNAIIQLNELTQVIAQNDQAVRDFSGSITNVTGLLAEQAPGLEAVLAQLNDFLANTSAVLAENKDQLGGALTRLGSTTDMLKQNADRLKEVVDVTPMLMQNIDNTVAQTANGGAIRLHALIDKGLLDNELLSLFCERIQMRSDGCRTGKLKDFGPDFGLTAALLGMTGQP